jgi:hypothetical protein
VLTQRAFKQLHVSLFGEIPPAPVNDDPSDVQCPFPVNHPNHQGQTLPSLLTVIHSQEQCAICRQAFQQCIGIEQEVKHGIQSLVLDPVGDRLTRLSLLVLSDTFPATAGRFVPLLSTMPLMSAANARKWRTVVPLDCSGQSCTNAVFMARYLRRLSLIVCSLLCDWG